MTTSLLGSFRPFFETLSALAQGQKVARAAELQPLRGQLRERLLALRQELTPRLSERETWLVLLALVVHVDEIVRTRFPEADYATWPLLQKELFDTDRGGELFYQCVAELIESQKLTSIVYQVYYFCLSLGFRGKYAQEPERRTQLMHELRERLTLTAPAEADGAVDLARERPAASVRVPRVPSTVWPYAGAAAVVIVLFVALSMLAASTSARWHAAPAVDHCAQEGASCRSS